MTALRIVAPGPGFRPSTPLEPGRYALDAGVLNFKHKGTFVECWLLETDGNGAVKVDVGGRELWTGRRSLRRIIEKGASK